MARKILDNHKDDFEVTLVDKNDYQLFYPALFNAVSSLADLSELFSVVAIKFRDIFKDGEIEILKKEVSDIDFGKNRVVLKSPARLKSYLNYDYLVLAPGSETDFKGTEFAGNKALPFKTFEDALKIKVELEHLLKNKAKKEGVVVAVIGGGVTGCSLVSCLHDYVHKLASLTGHPHQTISFKLISGEDEIFPALPAWSRKTGRKILEKMGVEIFTGSYAKSVEEAGCVLSDGTFVGADITVWAGGVKPNRLVEIFPEEDKNINLRAQGQKNVFFMGDFAYPGKKFGKEAPTAQTAVRHAKYIAYCLGRIAKGKKIKKTYRPGKSIYIVEMGEKNVFVGIGPAGLIGWPARFIRRQAFLRYLKSIMPLHKALSWLGKFSSL